MTTLDVAAMLEKISDEDLSAGLGDALPVAREIMDRIRRDLLLLDGPRVRESDAAAWSVHRALQERSAALRWMLAPSTLTGRMTRAGFIRFVVAKKRASRLRIVRTVAGLDSNQRAALARREGEMKSLRQLYGTSFDDYGSKPWLKGVRPNIATIPAAKREALMAAVAFCSWVGLRCDDFFAELRKLEVDEVSGVHH